jgi:hypothetical protein
LEHIKPREIASPRSSPDNFAFLIAFINLENNFANIDVTPAKLEPRKITFLPLFRKAIIANAYAVASPPPAIIGAR